MGILFATRELFEQKIVRPVDRVKRQLVEKPNENMKNTSKGVNAKLLRDESHLANTNPLLGI